MGHSQVELDSRAIFRRPHSRAAVKTDGRLKLAISGRQTVTDREEVTSIRPCYCMASRENQDGGVDGHAGFTHSWSLDEISPARPRAAVIKPGPS